MASTDGSASSAPSLIRRSLVAVLNPFSPAALASLPQLARPAKYNRADGIPDDAAEDETGQRPTVRDYHSINLPPQVRIPKKIPTAVKVEAKVWFANERTWVAWLDVSILIGTLALALFNASKDKIATNFAYAYATISVVLVVYAFLLYQRRISLIRRRYPGHFDAFGGPIILGVALFVAVLANFLFKVRELNKKGVPFPGVGFFFRNGSSTPLSFKFNHN